MNVDKLKKLQSQVRIGGKGTPRRKKKVVHQTAATDDKKLQGSLKKLAVNTIAGIEEVNMIKDDGTVINFNNPKTQASLASNIFAITGHGETKQITEMLPGILTQLGPEGLNQLKRLASNVVIGNKLLNSVNEEDDDVPNLVENFEETAKKDEEAQKTATASTSQAPATTTTAATTTTTTATEAKEEPKPEEVVAKVEEKAAEPVAVVAAPAPAPAAAPAPAPAAAPEAAAGGKGGKKDEKPKTPEPKKDGGKKAEGKGATPKKDDKTPKKKEDKKNA